jgi:Leucine-rich repeat (LRR) protein
VNLRKLDLSNGNIETLPAELGRLINLKDLSASANSLTAIPNELKDMRRLADLNLGLNLFPPDERKRLQEKYSTKMLFRRRRAVL